MDRMAFGLSALVVIGGITLMCVILLMMGMVDKGVCV